MANVVNTAGSGQEEENTGSTPLSTQGGSAQTTTPDTSGQFSGDSGAPLDTGDSAVEAGQGEAQSKAAPKSSSGMFTNIQKYVSKNRPQAQKMSQTVQQDIGKQASDIRQQAQDKQAQTQAQLDANKKAMESARTQAQQQVSAIMNPQLQASGGTVGAVAQEVQQPTQEQAQTFQDLMSGEFQGKTNVQGVNLSPEQAKMQSLQSLAGRARTEEGRKNLLRQTFQDQGQYNRGMSGLDQLILAGDDQARSGLITGIEQQAGNLQADLKDIGATTRADIQAQQRSIDTFGEDIGNLASGELKGLQTGIDTAYEDALAARKALFDPESSEYQRAVAAAESNIQSARDLLGEGSYADFIESLISGAYKGARELGIRGKDAISTNIQKYVDNLRQFEDTGTVTKMTTQRVQDPFGRQRWADVPVTLSGKEAEAFLQSGGGVGSSHWKHEASIRSLIDLANEKLGLDKDLYGVDAYANKFRKKDTGKMLGGLRDYFTQQFDKIGSGEDVVRRQLESQFGKGYEDLAGAKDLQRLDVASQSDIDKINALKTLIGKQDLITEQQYGDQEYTKLDSLQNLLGKYK